MLEDFLNWFNRYENYFSFLKFKIEFTFDTELNKNVSVSLILNNEDISGKIILSINGECELVASWNGYDKYLVPQQKMIFENKTTMEKELISFIETVNNYQKLAWYCRIIDDDTKD